MNDPAPPSSTSASPPSLTAPLLLWLLIQLAALLLAAARVPLAARFDQPAEQFAVHEMIVVQIIAMSMLFPLLLRNWLTTIVILVSSWPFTQLAALLAPVETMRWIAAGGCVSLWILSLACWRAILRASTHQLIAVAVATCVAIGGPLLWYLRGEFAKPAATLDWTQNAYFGPVLAALAQLHSPFELSSWAAPAGIFIISATCLLISNVRARND